MGGTTAVKMGKLLLQCCGFYEAVPLPVIWANTAVIPAANGPLKYHRRPMWAFG